jgi:hypothetical protein
MYTSILITAVITAVLSMIVGFVWYSPMLFANAWMKELGLTMEKIGNGPGVGYLVATLSSAILGAAVATVIKFTNTTTVVDALAWGLIIAVGFIGTSFATNYVFAQKSKKLFLIDAGYFMVVVMIAAVLASVIR